MTTPTENHREEVIQVNKLEIDRRVQREGLNRQKVQRMVKRYNKDALGIISVSERKDRSLIIIDGQHRWDATRIVTDNEGFLQCRVFTGLTLAQEAQMFLDLNETTKPPVIDLFKVQQNADGPEGDAARDIAEILMGYGWKISRVPADGNINAVKVVQRMYELSEKVQAEPNLLRATILVIDRAWGKGRHGAQGAIFEGIARMFAEYGSRLDLDRMIEVCKTYQGGPQTLIAEASQMAALRKGKVSMAVAELLVEQYNKGRRTRHLETWRKRV